MSDINKLIKEYIESYCEKKEAPGYAILIKGKWGTGKTWFIKKIKNDLEGKRLKLIHISVYGMGSISEIDNELYRAVHPILGSKKMVLAGKLFKGFIKTSIHVDLDSDGKSDGSISSTIPDINLMEYLEGTKDNILIFDDIERCSIPISNLLGYLNHFVEQGDHKILLVANEEEIIKLDEKTKNEYLKIKEKLIGKTFEITPHSEEALEDFISKVENENLRKELTDKRQKMILELYDQSLHRNLRHLKQAIDEFSNIYECISEKAKEKDDLLNDLLYTFLVFTFEARSGYLTPNEIKDLKNSYWSSLTKSEINKYKEISLKYGAFDLDNIVIPLEKWKDIFDKGVYDRTEIKTLIDGSKYFYTDTTPAWKKLWYLRELDDVTVDDLYEKIEHELINNAHTTLEVIIHLFGIYLFLAKLNYKSLTKRIVLSKYKKYVEKLCRSEILDYKTYFESPFSSDSYDGLGYQSMNEKEFILFKEYINLLTTRYVNKKLPKKAEELIKKISKEKLEFVNEIKPAGLYYELPILKFFDVNVFIEELLKLEYRDRWTLVKYLTKERYQLTSYAVKIVSEYAWHKKVSIALRKASKKEGVVRRNHFLELADAFLECSENIKNIKDESILDVN